MEGGSRGEGLGRPVYSLSAGQGASKKEARDGIWGRWGLHEFQMKPGVASLHFSSINEFCKNYEVLKLASIFFSRCNLV